MQEELKSTTAAQLKQAHASSVYLGGTIAMKMAMHVTTSRAENFMGSNWQLKGTYSVYEPPAHGVLIQKEQTTGKMTDCCKRLNNMTPVPYKTLIKQVYFSLYNAEKGTETYGRGRKSLAKFAVSWSAVWGLYDMWNCSHRFRSTHYNLVLEHKLTKPEKKWTDNNGSLLTL